MITRKAAYEAVTDHVVMLLKREPLWSVDDLAEQSGYSTATIRIRLTALKDARRVYTVEISGRGGIRHYWQYGPKPADMKLVNADARLKYEQALPPPRELRDSDQPTQRTVRTWAPNLIRNEFDVFLFGPARREAA